MAKELVGSAYNEGFHEQDGKLQALCEIVIVLTEVQYDFAFELNRRRSTEQFRFLVTRKSLKGLSDSLKEYSDAMEKAEQRHTSPTTAPIPAPGVVS